MGRILEIFVLLRKGHWRKLFCCAYVAAKLSNLAFLDYAERALLLPPLLHLCAGFHRRRGGTVVAVEGLAAGLPARAHRETGRGQAREKIHGEGGGRGENVREVRLLKWSQKGNREREKRGRETFSGRL